MSVSAQKFLADKWYHDNKEDIVYLLNEFRSVCNSVPKTEFLNYFYANDSLYDTTKKGFPYKQYKAEKVFKPLPFSFKGESNFLVSEDSEGNVLVEENSNIFQTYEREEREEEEKDPSFDEQMKVAEEFVSKARNMGFLQGHMAVLDLAYLIRAYECDVDWVWQY